MREKKSKPRLNGLGFDLGSNKESMLSIYTILAINTGIF